MSTWMIVVGIILICIIGFTRKFVYIYELANKQEFALEYRNKFVDLTNKRMDGVFDSEVYGWLTYNADKMQRDLGVIGLISYIDNLKGVKASNVPALLNTLPEFQQQNDISNSIIKERLYGAAQTCVDILTRHQGLLNSRIDNTRKEIINPFSLFAEGFRWIIHLPINCLYWLGIMSYDTAGKVKRNFLIVLVEKITMILTLISTIMSIVVGWDEFIVIVTSIIEKVKALWG